MEDDLEMEAELAAEELAPHTADEDDGIDEEDEARAENDHVTTSVPNDRKISVELELKPTSVAIAT